MEANSYSYAKRWIVVARNNIATVLDRSLVGRLPGDVLCIYEKMDFVQLGTHCFILKTLAAFVVSLMLACTSESPNSGAANYPVNNDESQNDSSQDSAVFDETSSVPLGITIDLDETFQTIDGWETYLRMWEEDKVNDRFDKSIEVYTDLVADHLVTNVGINRVRLEVWSGLENPVDYWSAFYSGELTYSAWKNHRYQKINDNDDPLVTNPEGFQFARFDYAVERMLLPMKRAMEAIGEELYVNLCYVDFKWSEETLQGTFSHAKNEDEYAEFISVFVNRLNDKYGVIVDSIEIILEPENTESWRGTQIGRAVVEVADRLQAEGFSPEIVAPSTTSMRRAVPYFNEMAQVSGAVNRLDTLAYHRYGGESLANARQIRQTAESSGVKTAMLEKVEAGIDQLFEDLTEANVSAWTQYGMAALANPVDRNAAHDQGANYVVVRDSREVGPKNVANASKSNELAQLFRFVRRDAKRVNSVTQADRDVQLAAFRNADESVVVVIRSTEHQSAIQISGLPAGSYRTEFLPADSSVVQRNGLINYSEIDRPLLVSMPMPGMLSVVSD